MSLLRGWSSFFCASLVPLVALSGCSSDSSSAAEESAGAGGATAGAGGSGAGAGGSTGGHAGTGGVSAGAGGTTAGAGGAGSSAAGAGGGNAGAGMGGTAGMGGSAGQAGGGAAGGTAAGSGGGGSGQGGGGAAGNQAAGGASGAGSGGMAGAAGSPTATKILQISVGDFPTCALLDTGKVRCWGYGAYGALGYGNETSIGDDETPASAGDLDIGGLVTQIATGSGHACALLTTGKVRCWGDGEYSKLGYGNEHTIGDDETPADAGDVDVGGTVTQIAAGYVHTCALLDTGKVRCWGAGDEGEPGYGNTKTIGDDETPASAGDIDIGGQVAQIAAGDVHTCALLTTGKVRCWGFGGDGQLGYGNLNSIGDNETPASAGDVDIGGQVAQIDAGDAHTCALLTTGKVRCWGFGGYGALGYGNKSWIGDNESPASAGDVDVGGTVVQISAGGEQTCALLDTGKVRCWGNAILAGLGYGNLNSIGDDETPASAGDVPVF